MYGIIIWLSERGQSALIVTDGGRNLAFGRCEADPSTPFAVGDLVYVHGLRAGQDKFEHGISPILAGFWPDVQTAITARDTVLTCNVVKRSGNLGHGIARLGADNLAAAPKTQLEKKSAI